VLSGKLDSTYSSTNWVYLYTPDPMQPEQVFLLGPLDYDAILGDPVEAAKVQQVASVLRLQSQSRATVNPVMDLFVGLRGRVWKDLELLLGFRNAYYGDVGVDLRPKNVTATSAGMNYQDVTEVDRSAGYDGGYFCVAYTF
jgi:hypothetical protein